MRPILHEMDIPPFWLALHVAGAWLLSLLSPSVFGSWGDMLGKALILGGALLMGVAIAQMVRQRTTVIPRRDPASLVTSGLFSLSRNPIYLADAIILAGAIMWLDAVLALPLLFTFTWLIQTRFILDEEARLTLAFGPEFDLWAGRTRRWLGRR